MKPSKNFWQSVVVVTGLLIAAAASADTHGSRVVAPGQELFGESYNELAGKWTNWLVAEPIATNPAFDPDGRFCDRSPRETAPPRWPMDTFCS
ncbi:MAG TPA: hypothetical protein VKM72_30440 [Thermoanaerobaculia bacterium]|nr:hypothetical protein [Thermoanaerobaculia bacterium]